MYRTLQKNADMFINIYTKRHKYFPQCTRLSCIVGIDVMNGIMSRKWWGRDEVAGCGLPKEMKES